MIWVNVSTMISPHDEFPSIGYTHAMNFSTEIFPNMMNFRLYIFDHDFPTVTFRRCYRRGGWFSALVPYEIESKCVCARRSVVCGVVCACVSLAAIMMHMFLQQVYHPVLVVRACVHACLCR